MRHFSRFLVCFLVVLAASSLGAATSYAGEYQYKSVLTVENGPREVGGERVGDIFGGGLSLYVTDPATHSMLFGFQYKEFSNSVPEIVGLQLPKSEFSAGFCLPVSRRCSFKVAYTQQEFLNDQPFSTFGIYPQYSRNNGSVQFGLERDQQGTTFSFLQGKLNNSHGVWYYNASFERFLEGHAVVIDNNFARVGGGYLYSVPETRFRLLLGGNYNPVLEKTTWVVGASHHADRNATGISPAFAGFYRVKPSSRYALGILALWSDFGKYPTTAIHDASIRGSLKRTRLIAGQSMGDPGIGSAHDTNDFGLVTFAVSLLTVDAGTDATLYERDFSSYMTHPNTLGPITRPYVGMTWVKSSDLVYNYALHQLTDPEQTRFELKIGGKFHVGTAYVKDDDYELGYLRCELMINSDGGGRIQIQRWF